MRNFAQLRTLIGILSIFDVLILNALPIAAQGHWTLTPLSNSNALNLAELEIITIGTMPINAVTFSPTDSSLLVAESALNAAPVAKRMILWDLESRKRLRSWLYIGVSPESLDFAPDGQSVAGLAVGTADSGASTVPSGKVGFVEWSLSTSRIIRQFDNPAKDPMRNSLNDSLRAARISPDGLYAISASADGVFYLWERATGKLIQTIEPDGPVPFEVTNVQFSQNGRLVATCNGDSTIRLWLITQNSMQPLAILRTEFGDLLCDMVVSPDGRIVASVGKRNLYLWESASGTLSQTIAIPRNETELQDNRALIFSADSTLLGIMIANREMNTASYRFVDMNTRTIIHTIDRPEWSSGLAINHAGTLLASGLANGRVVLFGVHG